MSDTVQFLSRVLSIDVGCSAAAPSPLPPTSWAHAVVREGHARHQQVRTQLVDDQLLGAAERCAHVGCLDIHDHLQIGYSPWLDPGFQVTQECLLRTGWALLEPQEHQHGEGTHWLRTLAVHQRASGSRTNRRPATQQRPCSPVGGGPWLFAAGLLHVLRADSWTGGDVGSRAGEAKKSGRRARGPVARWGLLRRALMGGPGRPTGEYLLCPELVSSSSRPCPCLAGSGRSMRRLVGVRLVPSRWRDQHFRDLGRVVSFVKTVRLLAGEAIRTTGGMACCEHFH